MRKVSPAPDEYYHLFNRGAFKHDLFENQADYIRFLFYILYSQSPVAFVNTSRIVHTFNQEQGFAVSEEETADILKNRFVELVAFCIMPNHFHLLVKEIEEGGIANYMQRIGIGYTKYFNTKREINGRIFQGVYGAVHINDDTQLLYTSAYIHRNPRELRAWKGREFEYPWSSLQDFTEANRWGGLLMSDIIAGQFDASSNSNYKDFIKTSTAKMVAAEVELVMSDI